MEHKTMKKKQLGMGDTKPSFRHDCKFCQFLGVYNNRDLYMCSAGPGETVIARYSDEGGSYTSGLVVARSLHLSAESANDEVSRHGEINQDLRALRVAYLIARDTGLCA
jgi:hypothetical protein